MELIQLFGKFFGESATHDHRPVVEAIATWTENLRDAMAAASGLEQAIIATSLHSPPVLNVPVQRLVASLQYESLEIALRRFADDVSHPTCDFVVTALITASKHQTRDLGQLLTHLSECARAECYLYLRIWVSRARSRTAVRIIFSVLILFLVGLLVFDRQYLSPFLSIAGLAVGLIVAVLFGISLVWLLRIAQVTIPNRLLRPLEKVSA